MVLYVANPNKNANAFLPFIGHEQEDTPKKPQKTRKGAKVALGIINAQMPDASFRSNCKRPNPKRVRRSASPIKHILNICMPTTMRSPMLTLQLNPVLAVQRPSVIR